MSDLLIAKRDAARKSLDRWLLSRDYKLTDSAREFAEKRIAFWEQRVAELDQLIREAAA